MTNMRYIQSVIIIVLLTNILIPFGGLDDIVAVAQPTQPHDLMKRLENLEPPTPTDIQIPFFQRPFPSKTNPIKDVMRTGNQLPFRLILSEPQWQRPLYREQWHSTYSAGRWSYIPLRLFYAQHRIFATSAVGLSNMYDFLHNLGLSDLNVEEKGASQEE
ncbi:hypothetical protein [Cohnella lupini]|uniref:hypothetical protein n=1 Tax=Cohnella lupini TaxID=1294267 RepID=UPI0011C03C5D|nr:hypothetical protein [Cohnella lupini]